MKTAVYEYEQKDLREANAEQGPGSDGEIRGTDRQDGVYASLFGGMGKSAGTKVSNIINFDCFSILIEKNKPS